MCRIWIPFPALILSVSQDHSSNSGPEKCLWHPREPALTCIELQADTHSFLLSLLFPTFPPPSLSLSLSHTHSKRKRLLTIAGEIKSRLMIRKISCLSVLLSLSVCLSRAVCTCTYACDTWVQKWETGIFSGRLLVLSQYWQVTKPPCRREFCFPLSPELLEIMTLRCKYIYK